MGVKVADSVSLSSGWRRYVKLRLSVAKKIFGRTYFTKSDPPKSKVETVRSSMKSVVTRTATETTRKTSSQATRKKSQQAGASVDSFLESLGLEKYSTAFQVEEVDMDALMRMTDDDLKAMLIPMISSMLNCHAIFYYYDLYQYCKTTLNL